MKDYINRAVNKLINRADAKFQVPRRWSNRELRKFAPIFHGRVVNVSGWTDTDKEGGLYKDYFCNASDYYITNYKAEQKGMQNQDNEIFLDLEGDVPHELKNSFNVVFNHTTLEHIYDCRKAFHNLCLLSRDVVIVVVSYIQQLHGIGYPDYWRFTPLTMKKIYDENGLTLRYCSANGKDRASIYLFCIGYQSKNYDKHISKRLDLKLDEKKELYADYYTNVIGGNVIK